MDNNVDKPETADEFEITSALSKTNSLNKTDSKDVNEIEENFEPMLLKQSIISVDQSEFEKLSKSFDTYDPSTKLDVSKNGFDSLIESQADVYNNTQIKEGDFNSGFSNTDSLVKSVSFVEEIHSEVEDKIYSSKTIQAPNILSRSSYETTNSSLASGSLASVGYFGTLQSKMPTKKSLSSLQNIPEVDENTSGGDETPGYYGWDGYEARFEKSLQEKDSLDSIPKCIPPWAKSVRKTYGLPFLESVDKLEESNLQERIENFMKKHKEAMLLKRVESKKQVVVEPSKDPNELDTVKLRAKSTRYYMTPLTTLGKDRPSVESYGVEDNTKYTKISLHDVRDSENMSITKNTSRPEAKREISSVLKSFAKKTSKKLDEIKEHEKLKKGQNKCPKITLSKLREFVNMDAEGKKLHEIIKIEKVPSAQNLKLKETPASKYIINVPPSKNIDKATLNVIKIKEKRKLRVGSIENLEEKVTELRYNNEATQKHVKKESDYNYSKNFKMEPDQLIKKKVKSPTETKTFQVIAKETPVLSPLVCERAKESDKVLLIQYDKRSKSSKLKDGKMYTHKSQLVGIKEPCTDSMEEMYFYDSESDGKQTRENFTKEDKIPPTLKDKVHLIFEELRDLALKPGATREVPSTSQVPSCFQVKTEAAKVQAMPETRSAEVQVTNSQLLEKTEDDSHMLMVPHPSPASISDFKAQELRHSFDNERLYHKLDLIPSTDILTENISDDLVQKNTVEKIIEQQINDMESKKLLSSDEEITKTKTEDEILTEQQPSIEEQSIGGTTDSSKVMDISQIDEEEKMSKEITEIESLSYSETKQLTSEDETQETLLSELQIKEPTSGELVKTDDQISITTTEISEAQSKEPVSEGSKIQTTERKLQQTLSKTLSKLSSKALSETSKPTLKVSVKPASVLSKNKIVSKDGPIEHASSPFQDIKTILSMSKDEEDTYLTKSLTQHQDDIISYDIQPEQFHTLYNKEFKSSSFESVVTKTSSKFLHPKDALRKMVNWTDDTIYLENNTCPGLIRGLAETGMRQPTDPIAFLAHWIYKDYENHESREREEVKQEHLSLAKTMEEVSGKQTHSKFHVRKYPMKKLVENVEKLEDVEVLSSETTSQEVIQEA